MIDAIMLCQNDSSFTWLLENSVLKSSNSHNF